MTEGGTMYDNRTKDTWRGWAWNQVCERMGKIALMIAAKVVGEMWYGLEKKDRMIPKEMFDLMRPDFYSYRSKDSGQYFDSVAITTKSFRLQNGDPERMRKLAPVQSRRRAAAAKALLTMRHGK